MNIKQLTPNKAILKIKRLLKKELKREEHMSNTETDPELYNNYFGHVEGFRKAIYIVEEVEKSIALSDDKIYCPLEITVRNTTYKLWKNITTSGKYEFRYFEEMYPLFTKGGSALKATGLTISETTKRLNQMLIDNDYK